MLRAFPPLFAALSLVAIPLASLGCGGNAASQLAKAPEFDPKGQTKCGVTKSQAHPLIVEWPSADRAELEDHAKRGLVAVRYSGCEMELVASCRVSGAYGYTALTRKRDRVVMRDADDLYANLPVGAAKLEAKLQKSGELNVAMTIVGRYNADRFTVHEEDLAGDCAQATHVVTGFTAGAFEFFAGADAEVGAGADLQGVGAGARSSAKRETLNQDGDDKACEKSTDDDKKPPSGCGALLRIEVVAIGRSKASPAPEGPMLTSAPPPAASRPLPASQVLAARADRDGDGIPDDMDKCPDDPEDKDGFEDEDGCPDPDNDKDTVLDVNDKCPNVPGPVDNGGCPRSP